MGGWKLEAFKMCLYMSFPVGAFCLFNRPSFYENALFEWRRELDTITDPAPELKELIRRRQEMKLQKDIEAMNAMPTGEKS